MTTSWDLLESEPGVFRTSTAQDELTLVVALGVAMGLAVSLAFTAATVLVLVKTPALTILTAPGVLGGLALLGYFGRELLFRSRRMGAFVLDANRRTLLRHGSQTPMPVSRIRPSTFMAPSFQALESSWWVLVELADRRSFRVARGSWAEVRPMLLRLRQLGLEVEGAEPECLLHTRHFSIRRVGPSRLEFRNPESLGKIIAPLVLVSWLGLAGVFATSLLLAASRGQLGTAVLCAVPLALFFGFGIFIGAANTLALFRRSGIFVLDTSNGSLVRNGRVLTDRTPITRIRLGSPTAFGLRRSRTFGPQVLAADMKSGRLFHLARSLPGDVRFAAEVLRSAGVQVEE